MTQEPGGAEQSTPQTVAVGWWRRGIDRRMAGAILVGLFLLNLCCYLPWASRFPASPLDQSWCLALQWAHGQHLDFGHQVDFTFGPWGFIFEGYTVATFPWCAAGWAFFAAAAFFPLWFAAKRTLPPRVALLWTAGIVLLLGGDGVESIEPRLLSLGILLIVVHFFIDDRAMSWAKSLLVVALAWASLTKFSVAIMAAGVVSAVTVDLLIRRRVPWLGLVYMAAVPAFWLLADQAMGSLLPYLHHSLQITGGYAQGEGMASNTEMLDLALFAAGAAPLLAIIVYAHSRRPRNRRPIAGIAAAAIVLFLTFKIGYIRHDRHELAGTAVLAAMACLYLPGLWPRMPGRTTRTLLVSTVLACLAISVQSQYRHDEPTLPTKAWQSILQFPGRLLSVAGWISGSHQATADIATTAKILADPAPPLSDSADTCDIYPWNIHQLLNAGMNYHPRPVLQSYLAYTTELARINADFLASADAPREIFFNVDPIDGHLASEEDSLSWPELLSIYNPAGTTGGFLRLQRSAQARNGSLVPLGTVTGTLGQRVTVPTSDDPIWVSIQLRPTALGRLIGAVYRPPLVYLNLASANGKFWTFHLLPEVARGGFLLSPVVEDTPSFASLYRSDWKTQLSGDVAARFTLSGHADADLSGSYEGTFTVSFSALRMDQEK